MSDLKRQIEEELHRARATGTVSVPRIISILSDAIARIEELEQERTCEWPFHPEVKHASTAAHIDCMGELRVPSSTCKYCPGCGGRIQLEGSE